MLLECKEIHGMGVAAGHSQEASRRQELQSNTSPRKSRKVGQPLHQLRFDLRFDLLRFSAPYAGLLFLRRNGRDHDHADQYEYRAQDGAGADGFSSQKIAH